MQVDTLCDPDHVYVEDDVDYLLSKLPGTLEETYAKILNDLDGLPPPSREAIKNTCRLLICAERPMQTRQLLEALAILSGSRKAAVDKVAILKMARGLIIEEFEQNRLTFAHLSVREFLETQIELSGQQAHLVAAEACLKFCLKSDIKSFENSHFRPYALLYLGRHCMKSGTLRQKTKLQGLMEDFLLAKGSNNAFERWNRSCSESYLMLPGNHEILRCTSFPALPLFMICIYGFNDFVIPSIENCEGALYAENSFDERPLEVAALYGNYETMVILYNATSPTNISSIRAEHWLEAAAQSSNLDIWNYAIKHIPNIPLDVAVVEAARNPLHGKEMISGLSNYKIDINETLLVEVLKDCASFEALDMIFGFSTPAKFTESALEAAVQNPRINPKLTEMILSNNPRLRVSETCMVSASDQLCYSPTGDTAVVGMLLNHPIRCEVTEELIHKMMNFPEPEDFGCLSLLLQHSSVDHITEDLLVDAASSPAYLNYLINHTLRHTISQSVLQSALSGFHCEKMSNILYSRPECPLVHEESMYIMLENWYKSDGSLSNAVNKCEPMYITNAYIQACAAKTGIQDFEYIVFLPRAIPLSKDVLCAAVKNSQNPCGMLELLLETKSGSPEFMLEPSEELLFQALSSPHWLNTLELVLNDNLPNAAPPDTDEETTFEAVLFAASKNGELAQGSYELTTSTLKLDTLVSKYRGPSLDSNRLVEIAAERKDGNFVVQYLLSRFPETIVTETALVAAASNEVALASLLDLLLKHFHDSIDSKLLQLAAGNRKRGTQMVELLLAIDPDITVDEAVITAALRNPFCAGSLFKLFLRRHPDLAVTQDIIDAASENEVLGKGLLQMLLKRALTSCSMTSADLVFNKMKCTADGLHDSLFMAACYGEDEVLKFLISRNVSISTVSEELGTALNVAVYAEKSEAVEILLNEGGDPEFRSGLYGSPLETACRKGNLSIVRTLARHGAEIDRSNQIGRTVLHTAAKNGAYDVVDLLISLGASTAKQDRQGMAAIHHACLYKNPIDCVNILIEAGAPVNQEDSQQWTPLHWAAKSGGADVVTRLLEAGASKNKIETSGKSPLQVAIFCGNVHLRPQLFLPDAPDLITGPMGEQHRKIVCGICGLDIYGPRYKCTDCRDFGLCFRCIFDAKEVHKPEHRFEQHDEPD
ncbi:MAG: hypothetical protein Q9167_007336 [Letrouitia subvulpina]